jgi:hypothetical protein
LKQEDQLLITGWIEIDGGPRWFQSALASEMSVSSPLWVSGYIFENGNAVKTLKDDDDRCRLYDTSDQGQPPRLKNVEQELLDSPEIKHLFDAWATAQGVGLCRSKVLIDGVKVFDTPFSNMQGGRDYRVLNRNDEVEVVGWHLISGSRQWFRIQEEDVYFWVLGMSFLNEKQEKVFEPTDTCKNGKSVDLYAENYKLLPPTSDSDK